MKKILSTLLCIGLLFSIPIGIAYADTPEKVEVSFSYSENFDTMANGTLPAGWTLVKGKSTDSAQVVDHALQLKSEDWYANTYLFFDFDEVLRAGLTMECDITRIGISNESGNGNKNNSRAGLLYATDYDADAGTVNTANYIAPCTYKDEAYSAIMVKDLGEGPSAKTYQNASGSSTLQFNWETRETPVHLRIVAGSNTGKSPDIYIDGQKAFYYNTYASGTTSGKIGLYAYNCYVAIDNIVVSGTKLVTPAPYDEGFYYSENFDTMENGALPAGWTLVKGKSTDSAQVVDHALQLKSEDWYANTYLFFDFDEVLRAGLTMECDITRIGISNESGNGNKNNSRAGLLYATDYDADAGTVNTANYIAPCTYKDEVYSAIMVKDLGEGPSAKTYQNASGSSTLQFNWETRETPVHLRIVAGNSTGKSPDIYIDGEKVFYYNTYASGTTSGKIGLYAYNCYVSIDNIVVSGTKRTYAIAAPSENSISCAGSEYSNNELKLALEGKKTDTADKTVFVAVYDTSGTDEEMVAVTMKNWGGAYKDLRTDIRLSLDSMPALKKIAVYAWDMANGALTPLCPGYELP